MKKLLIVLFLSVGVLSCDKKVGLSGEIINQTIKTEAFTAVLNNSSARIEVDSTVSANEILLIGDKSLIDNLEIANENGQLALSNKESVSIKGGNNPLLVKINNPDLQKLVIAGAGSFATNNIALTNDVEFHISGAGEINAKVKNNITNVSVTGAGSIRLRGVSNELKATMTGAGNLKAEELTNKLANIEISGAGNAKINTSEEINVRISGVGNLKYKEYDQLKIVKKISGIGNVKPY